MRNLWEEYDKTNTQQEIILIGTVNKPRIRVTVTYDLLSKMQCNHIVESCKIQLDGNINVVDIF